MQKQWWINANIRQIIIEVFIVHMLYQNMGLQCNALKEFPLWHDVIMLHCYNDVMPQWMTSIKSVMLFMANFDSTSPPVTLCHPSRAPWKYVTHLGPPIFSRPSTKSRTKVLCTNSISIVRGGFCPGVLSGLVFVRSPFCHNTSVTTES